MFLFRSRAGDTVLEFWNARDFRILKSPNSVRNLHKWCVAGCRLNAPDEQLVGYGRTPSALELIVAWRIHSSEKEFYNNNNIYVYNMYIHIYIYLSIFLSLSLYIYIYILIWYFKTYIGFTTTTTGHDGTI